MKKSKKMKPFISLLVTFAILLVSMPIMSINVEAAECKCSNPSISTRTILPTCTMQGCKLVYCTRCSGEMYRTNYTAKLEHNSNGYTVTKYATCGATGSATRYCTGCNKTMSTVTIPATGQHSLSTTTTKAATCGATGTSVTKCSGCSYSITNTIAALGHYEKYEIIQPRCGTVGKRITTCSRTGCTYRTETTIPATEMHVGGDPKTTKQPTCTENGTKTTYCTGCNKVMSTNSIPALEHIEVYDVTEPTCGTVGKRVTTCSRTGCTYRTETTIPATEMHVGGDPKTTKQPTCTENGTKTTYCTGCNKVMSTNSIPALEHIEVYDVTEPTCVTTGKRVTTCSRTGCTYRTETTIPATEMHVGGDPKTTKQPTCTEKGTKTTYCTGCNKVMSTNSIPVLNHLWHTKYNATCGNEGVQVCVRENCSETNSISATDNHSPSTRITKPATCNSVGTKEIYCTVCSEVLSEDIITELPQHKIEYTPISPSLHKISCSGCTMNATDLHSFDNNICTTCGYDRSTLCSHPRDKRYRTYILPTCMNDYTIEIRCADCKKCLETKVISGTKGNHKLDSETYDTTTYTCGAKQKIFRCTVDGCKYFKLGDEIIHSADSNPTCAKRIIKEATKCTDSGEYEIYCTACNVVISTGTIVGKHTIPQYDEDNTDTWPNQFYLEGGDYEHEVKCKDCKEWLKVPHACKYVSNYDGTHEYKCICGYIEKTEDCYLEESEELIKDNGYTKEIITTYFCKHCNYSIEKTTYNHYKHTENITILGCDTDLGEHPAPLYTKKHSFHCDDEHCEGDFEDHIFTLVDPKDIDRGFICVACGIDSLKAEVDLELSYAMGGTTPFEITDAFDFATWDDLFGTASVAMVYLNNEFTDGKGNYIVWTDEERKRAIKIEYSTAEELKEALKKRYSLKKIKVIQ